MTMMNDTPVHVYMICENKRDGLHFSQPSLAARGFDGAYIVRTDNVRLPALIIPEECDHTCHAGRYDCQNAVVTNKNELEAAIDAWRGAPIEFYDEFFFRKNGHPLPHKINRPDLPGRPVIFAA